MRYSDLEPGDVLIGEWDDHKSAWLVTGARDKYINWLCLQTGATTSGMAEDSEIDSGYTLLRAER